MRAFFAKIQGRLGFLDRWRRAVKLLKVVRRVERHGPLGLASEMASDSTVLIGNIKNDFFYTLFDYLLARTFALEGRRVVVFIDDGYLSHVDSVRAKSLQQTWMPLTPWQARLRRWRIFRRKAVLSFLGIRDRERVRILYTSQLLQGYVPSSDLETRARVQKELTGALSKNVEASHRRHFGGRKYNPEDPAHRSYAETNLWNEAILLRVAQALWNGCAPSDYITLDATYTTMGTLFDFFAQRGVRCLTYQPNGFSDRHIYIGERPFEVNNVSAHWRKFLQNFDATTRQRAIEFMDRRLEAMAQPLNDEESKLYSKVIQLRQQGKKIVGVFPNLSWDGAIAERNTVFAGLNEWMVTTLEWAQRTGNAILLREHPQRSTEYNEIESAVALLKESVPDLEERPEVLVIRGPQRVSSYKLIRDLIDVSTVYSGTLIAEIAYLKRPVVIAGNSPYNHKDLGDEAKHPTDFCELLSKRAVQAASPDEVQRRFENALRAVAYQFIENSYFVPIMPKVSDFHGGGEKYWKSWDEWESIDPTKNEAWARTLRRFLERAE